VLAHVAESGADPAAVVAERGLAQVGADEVRPLLEAVIAANEGQWKELQGGKDKLRGFFVGQVMKASQGRADPGAVGELIEAFLRADPG